MSSPEMASTSLRSPFGDSDTPNRTPRASYLASSDRAPSSSQLISPGERVENDSYDVAGTATASSLLASPDNTYTGEKKSRRPIIWILVVLGIIALILVVVLPVYFVVVQPRNRNSSTESAPSTDNTNTPHL